MTTVLGFCSQGWEPAWLKNKALRGSFRGFTGCRWMWQIVLLGFQNLHGLWGSLPGLGERSVPGWMGAVRSFGVGN